MPEYPIGCLNNIFILKFSTLGSMNSRDIEFLTLAFSKYYGRVDSQTIDILELTRFYSKSEMKARNPFLEYAVAEKSDEDIRKDEQTCMQLIERINGSFQANQDSLLLDTLFQTLDGDKDGFIGMEDLLSYNRELGTQFTEEQLAPILEKITEEGTKLSKLEVAKIFWS